jgi:hypothetical protein
LAAVLAGSNSLFSFHKVIGGQSGFQKEKAARHTITNGKARQQGFAGMLLVAPELNSKIFLEHTFFGLSCITY